MTLQRTIMLLTTCVFGSFFTAEKFAESQQHDSITSYKLLPSRLFVDLHEHLSQCVLEPASKAIAA